jgi:hypothetical protein
VQTIDRRKFNAGLFLGFGLTGCVRQEPGLPDLVVTGIRWSEDDSATWHSGPIRAGSDVLFEADVKNQGTGPTPDGVIIGVAFRANEVMRAWSDHYTTALPAGQTISLRANGGPDGDRYWNDAQVGTYTIRAHVDHINGLANELNEADNTFEVPLTVEAAGDAITRWAGINANTGFYTSAGYVSAAEAELLDLNASSIRMGMDNLGGRTVGASFRWRARDAVVASHLAAGLKIHAGISPLIHVESGQNLDEWKDNWRHFCANVFRRYSRQVYYYIIGNEGDLNGLTPAEMVSFAQIAMEERDNVNPKVLLESDASSSPGKYWLRDCINLGVTRYVDVLGIHVYGGYASDYWLGIPWTFMKNAHESKGHPIIPVANSECGFSINWNRPPNWSAREAQAHWFALNRMQSKRFGYDNVLMYSINSTVADNVFDIADIETSAPYKVTRFQPTWETVQKINIDSGLVNAGFEKTNDWDTDWVVYWNPERVQADGPPEWQRVSFLKDGEHARTGSGYLRVRCGASNRVRQVVEGLTPGRRCTVTAFAKLSAPGPAATLQALGFNHLDGQQQSAESTTTAHTYQQLNVAFTPSRSWVVISLETTGGTSSQFIYWDDVGLVADDAT